VPQVVDMQYMLLDVHAQTNVLCTDVDGQCDKLMTETIISLPH